VASRIISCVAHGIKKVGQHTELSDQRNNSGYTFISFFECISLPLF